MVPPPLALTVGATVALAVDGGLTPVGGTALASVHVVVVIPAAYSVAEPGSADGSDR